MTRALHDVGSLATILRFLASMCVYLFVQLSIHPCTCLRQIPDEIRIAIIINMLGQHILNIIIRIWHVCGDADGSMCNTISQCVSLVYHHYMFVLEGK